MPDTVDVTFRQGLDAFTAVVDAVDPDEWDRPSACAGWTNLDVLGHLGTSIDFGVSLLRGEAPTWPTLDRPADGVVGDPAAYWAAIAEAARDALVGADLDSMRDTPMGRRSVADGLAFPVIDLFVHAWDIGHGLGLDVTVPDRVIELAHHHIDPYPEEVVRGPKGSFGPEVAVPADASASERFIGWTGRDPGAS